MDPQVISAAAALIGLLVGIVVGMRLGRASAATDAGAAPVGLAEELAAERATAAERLRAKDAEISRLLAQAAELSEDLATTRRGVEARGQELATMAERAKRIPQLEMEVMAEREQRAATERTYASLKTEYAELKTVLEAERGQMAEKLALLTEARDALSNQFKSLANEILEEKSKRFAEQNQTNLGQLLTPLKERLTEFKTKVEEIHHKDTEQQAALRTELAHLKEINKQMSDDANDLAKALKGQAKMQGNWGELVLENVLDRSGLRRGVDYQREVSFTTETGRQRPDVVVSLPQSKHLVIDAKVSLNAYTRYVNAEDDLERKQALHEHASAVASRIKELSDRSYFSLPGLNTPEMVFMFIPIESAFVEALKADEGLFQRAIEQNVLVATPTTLLTSLNIVRQLWRFEEQNLHTAELADKAAKVYKKLAGFVDSMQEIGKQLDKAKDSYSKALGQLYTGKGNLISQAKDFERLGVSVQTQLPEDLVSKAVLELDYFPEEPPREQG